MITDKHCLQNVLILAVWDDVNPVFDHSPKAIFQIYLHYKTVWWKTHLLCSDYRLLQPNEQTFVLSTSPVWTASSWLWCYLNFTACYFSCQKVTLTCITHQMWGKLLAGHPAGRGVWGRHHLTTTSWVYKRRLRTISARHPSLSLSLHICPVILHLPLFSKKINLTCILWQTATFETCRHSVQFLLETKYIISLLIW